LRCCFDADFFADVSLAVRNDRSSMPDEHLTWCSQKCANVWLRCSESTELLVHLLGYSEYRVET